MGALPSTKRWYAEDYPKSDEDFKRFLGQLNLFSEPMYNILNQGVDVTANTTEEIYTLQVNNASATATSNTFLFTPRKFIGAPHGVIIGQCLYLTDVPTAVGNPVTIDWVWTGSQISILAIYGLTALADYTLTLRIF